jgi:hypothetical protein
MTKQEMEQQPGNPAGNVLSTGVEAAQVLAAVKKSGFPLQTRVANILRTEFHLEEEWSFEDSQTKTLRTLDILGQKYLYELEEHGQPRARPMLSMLIECKQSDLPYVFFAGAKTHLQTFPVFAGLFNDKITIKTDDSRSTWSCGLMQMLSLLELPFAFYEPTFCMSFSKSVRKGKELELSGSEAFQGLVLPMVKAMQYFKKHVAPPKTAFYHDCHLVLGVAVIDAPMVLAETNTDDCNLKLAPWVRVVRHEAAEGAHQFERSLSYGIDVVHKDFFQTFVQKKIMPFARVFAERALKRDVELATGKAFATGMEKHGFDGIESRIVRK